MSKNKKRGWILFFTLAISSSFINVNVSASGNNSGNKLILNNNKALLGGAGKISLLLDSKPDTACFLDGNEKIYMKVNEMPYFPGGIDGLRNFCSKNMHYPKNVLTDNKAGIVHIGFIVGKDGTLRKARVVKSAGKELDEEALRVVQIMPSWEPGKLKGKKVPVYFVLPLSFEISNEVEKKNKVNEKSNMPVKGDEEMPFTYVEHMPEFPGGKNALKNFLTENVHYPVSALENYIQGTVVLRFIIEIDGSLSKVQVIRGVGGGCDEEAVRVVTKMPSWIPGSQNGKNVRVYFVLPVRFVLPSTKGGK